jgi:hypothetical protein
MRNRILATVSAATLVTIAALWVPALAAAQAQGQGQATQPTRDEIREKARQTSTISEEQAAKVWEAEYNKALAEATKLVYDPNKPLPNNPPKTPWGDPDLRGYYITATYTPLQRPKEVTKPLYTVEEAIGQFKRATDADVSADPAIVHYDWKEFGMEAWQSPVRPNLRTALITDTPDGRVPALTPEAQKRRAEVAALNKQRDHQSGVEIFQNSYTRCILGLGAAPLVRGGNPGSTEATAAGVSTEIQLFQSPGYLTIIHQSNNDLRVIPIKAKGAHAPSHVRQWYGDSIGHWEGNTLVVETTNFSDRAPMANFQGASDALTLTEKFSVLDDRTLRYEYTMNDPKTWVRPWSVEAPLPRIDPPLYEFACHEQNYGLINLVMGAQIRATLGEREGGRIGGE